MTPEEMAKNHQEWADKREARRVELLESTLPLQEEQVDAIEFAYKAIQEAEDNLREVLDITIEDARAISSAETKMRIAFPHLCIHPYIVS